MLQAAVGPGGEQLAVSVDGVTTTHLHALWLRDACGCDECRRPSTNERLLDGTKIEPGVTIVDAAITADQVRITMSDGHVATLGTEWLVSHLVASAVVEPADGRRLWTTGSALGTVKRARLDTSVGLVDWIDTINGAGAAVVTGVEPTAAGLHSVANLIGPIAATNYGVAWEIAATVEPVSAVDSERHLLVHTDLPYRTHPPGLQLLLAGVVGVDGGASTLVDGYAAAEELRLFDADAWKLLTRIEFTYPYVRDDIEIHGRAPMIGVRDDGRYGVIRRAPDLVGVPIVDADETPALYAALRQWAELLDDPAREMRIRLEPGELLAFDNHRMLHGRTAFELGASGRRHLFGCYLDLDDLASRRSVTRRSNT